MHIGNNVMNYYTKKYAPDGTHPAIQLFHGSCLDVMPSLPKDSASMIITSPPYNMNLRIRNGKYCSRQIVKELSTKYENYADNMPIDEYFDFNVKVVDECLRIAPIVFYVVQFVTGNKRALFRLMGHFNEQLKEVIVWDKLHGQPAISAGVLNSRFESILVFTRNGAISRRFDIAHFERGSLDNIWGLGCARGPSPRNYNGARFPDSLVHKIITNFWQGGTVLDPFMGSGTTVKYCYKQNIPSMGVDIDKNYFDNAATWAGTQRKDHREYFKIKENQNGK